MIDPKDEVFRNLDDQAREDDNNRNHLDAGFLGDEEQDTESGNVATEPEGHQTPKAMTIEQEDEKPWDKGLSGSTNLTEEQLEEVESPSSNKTDAAEQPDTEGTGYHEDPDQLKVGGEQ